MAETLTPSKEDIEANKAHQKSVTQQVEAQRAANDPDKITETVMFDSVLTTAAHVGKHPDEPHKDEEQEARKTGLIKPESGALDTVEVSAIESGEATDTVVLNAGQERHAAANPHTHDAIGISAVRAMAAGEDAPRALGHQQIVSGKGKGKSKSADDKKEDKKPDDKKD